MSAENPVRPPQEGARLPLSRELRVVIVTKKQRLALTRVAQGESRKSSGDEELRAINHMLGTGTATRAAIRALDLGIIDREEILRTTDSSMASREIPNLLNQAQRDIMHELTKNPAERELDQTHNVIGYIASKLNITPKGINHQLSRIYGQLGKKGMTDAAVLFKIATTTPQPIPKDTIVYINEEEVTKRQPTPGLTAENIRLLYLLAQGIPLTTLEEEQGDLSKQLDRIKKVIKTRARLTALIAGLQKRFIVLPSETELGTQTIQQTTAIQHDSPLMQLFGESLL